jgi:hypothetical protein
MAPQEQQKRVRETITAMIMTTAAAPEVSLKFLLIPSMQPTLGAPTVMSLYHHQVDGVHIPWQSRLVSRALMMERRLLVAAS